MSLIQKDFEKIENLLNRAFVILKHLESLLSRGVSFDNVRMAYARGYYTRLHHCYAYLRGLASIFEQEVNIHSETAQHMRDFEFNLSRLTSYRIKPKETQELESYFKTQCLESVREEEEKIRKIREALFKHFIGTRSYENEQGLLIELHGVHNFEVFGINASSTADEHRLLNEWVIYLKKFTGVIEAIYKILKRDEKIEEYLREELEKIYRKLDRENSLSIYPVTESAFKQTASLIEDLERAYDAM